MRRALAGAVLAILLATAACAPTYSAEYIKGSDLQTRYPDALEEARRGWAITTALALGLFAVWLAADLSLRGTGRRNQGAALVSAAAITAGLLGAWLLTATAGAYPSGFGYQVAASSVFWIGVVALAVGIAWLVRGFRGGPGDRGEAVWGFYLALLGVIVMPASLVTSFPLWLCAGSC
jgi:hypothetical protein